MRIRNLAAAVTLTAGLVATGAGAGAAMAADESVRAIAGPTPYANYAPAADGNGAARTADFTPNR
ncbi:hypothetical protein OHA37_35140 [Streptomyces sp. NBC_00335]|uniref:hypothetical protein n=1 Tax=unclassified Streptomyces TaxID=2593676 RepID=UPI002252734A|nr:MULTISPECIES: hypothetical protein [unclassified Streptomyces]MCX5409078.1 hypothetical protein [Streptomyces sp. NBC_00086]